MKKKNRIITLFLVGILLLTTGCGKSKDSPAESSIPAETVTAEQAAAPVSPEASLNSSRQAMVGTPQLFAVAYFGYHDTMDSDAPVDPYAVMQEQVPKLYKNLPFLPEIPAERVIGNHGDLFCIVPLDEDATVAVSKGIWSDSSEELLYEKSLYFAKNG